MNEDKRDLQSNPHDQPMIPEEGVNPALRELREKKQAHRMEAAPRPDEDPKNADDDAVDEASKESFPASDPPAY